MFALAQTLNGIIFDNKLRYTVIRQVQLTLKGPPRFTLWWCILQYLESWSRRVGNDKSTITGWDWNWDGVLLRTTGVTCWKRDIKSNPWSLTPWPNGLAKLNASFRLALNLRSLWPPTCVGLRRLSTTTSSNSHANARKFAAVWPPNASRHTLIPSQLYVREVYGLMRLAWTCETTCDPSQVRTQVLVLQTCVDLSRLARAL